MYLSVPPTKTYYKFCVYKIIYYEKRLLRENSYCSKITSNFKFTFQY